MKKLLLSFAVMLAAITSVNAQCTPDPLYTEPGIYPDSATGLDAACVGEVYNQLITNIVPVDTTTTIGGFPVTLDFDSVVIVSWTGLPAGFTYSCYDASNVTSPVDQCAFEGGTTGCALITGTPTVGDIGSYQQMITVDAYLAGLTTPQSTQVIDYYYIQVTDCTLGTGILSNSKFLIYPNPAKSTITLNGLNGIDVSKISIFNMTGKIFSTYENIDSPALDLDVNDLESGIYFVKIDYNGVSETIKFVKE